MKTIDEIEIELRKLKDTIDNISQIQQTFHYLSGQRDLLLQLEKEKENKLDLKAVPKNAP